MKPLVLAVGGTGGHIYPAIALGEAVRTMWPDVSVTVVGKKEGREEEAAARYGFGFAPIRVTRMPHGPAALVKFPSALGGAISDARAALRRIRPGAVVGFGGYVSFPTVAAALLMRIPVFLHEQNLAVGRANQMLSKFADGVFTSFEATAKQIGSKALFAGNPCRYDGMPLPDRGDACKRLGLDPARRTLFVFGGSQGAATLNRATLDFAAAERANSGLQILHATGADKFESVAAEYRGRVGDAGLLVACKAYLDEMELGYAAADAVLSRAGATSLTEITCFGVPAVLVPYPFATHGHQDDNARTLADAGAAVLIKDAELTGETLRAALAKLFEDRVFSRRMAQKAKAMYPAGSAKIMAERLRPCLAD
jgi:UDP-N-acetylglucosamine--N-acetylmuramyl-(pentapeptide) pyrophosphoryl-undecaprenol N-acetylglucosamine transferase